LENPGLCEVVVVDNDGCSDRRFCRREPSSDQIATVNAYVDNFVEVLDNFFDEGLEIARA
jgi:hypothetical protein